MRETNAYTLIYEIEIQETEAYKLTSIYESGA